MTGTGLPYLQKLMDAPAGEKAKWGQKTDKATLYQAPKSAEQQAAGAAAAAKVQEQMKAAQAKADAEAAKQKELSKGANATLELLTKHAPQPTSVQASAISSYTGSGYQSLNDTLRNSFTPAITPTMKNLDSYLAKAEFPQDVVLHRKVSGPYSKILRSIAMEGGKFIDKGYSSTSTHTGKWSGDLHLVISVKKGQRGAAVKEHSNHAAENEVVLPRGSAFVIKKIEGPGMFYVELDQSHMTF
jgi:hypothetical protein